MRSSEHKKIQQCGDENYEAGRQDWQYGCYNFVSTNLVKDKSVIDAHRGLASSHWEYFKRVASHVLGIDIDLRVVSNKRVCEQHEFNNLLIG